MISDDIAAISEDAAHWGGYRDGSTEYADVVTEGTTPADPGRQLLRKQELVQELFEADGNPQGHGFTSADVGAGKGYFSVHPMEGKPLRLIVLDTVNTLPNPTSVPFYAAQGALDTDQHTWLQAELAEADVAHELVIVMSHHRSSDFASYSPVSGSQLEATLSAAEGVVLHLTGHGHLNAFKSIGEEVLSSSDNGYWELMTSATFEFPMQSRIIEVVDERNGYVSIYVTNFDHNSIEGTPGYQARQLAAAEKAFSTVSGIPFSWEDDLAAQNLLLRIRIPDAVRDNLAKFEWPATIESEETLLSLQAPEQ
jgi:hypothetical protein